MSEPITPDEVISLKASILPKQLFTVVNELIATHWSENSATVKQKDIVAGLMGALELENSQIIYDQHYLDFEDTYRAQGWQVTYEKPSYGDRSFDAYFVFSRA